MYELARSTECDTIIGTSLAVDAAASAEKSGILVYAGKEAIRDACLRAAELARDNRETQQNQAIIKSLINNAQFGVIVTNAAGNVQLFNHTAQRYTGVAPSQIRGRPLVDFFPNLSAAALYKSGQTQLDSYRLIQGSMMRCMQEHIFLNHKTIGVLTTIYPDSHSRKKSDDAADDLPKSRNTPIHHWKDLISNSPAMRRAVEQGQGLARLSYPTAILGAPGSGRETIAHCLHNSSARSKEPCVVIDLATFAGEDAAHVLFGYEKQDCTVAGLLESANGGSVILKNIALATPIVLACLMQALTVRRIYRPGMPSPQVLDIIFFTVATREEFVALPPDLRSALSICQIDVPPLSMRKEDIGSLFSSYLSEREDMPKRLTLTKQMLELLEFYHWPGNLQELQAVSTRYAISYGQTEKPSSRTQYFLLLQAIGEDNLFRQIITLYPALSNRPIEDKDGFSKGISTLKAIMKYSNDELAEKLSVGRTTIWRIMQGDEKRKPL